MSTQEKAEKLTRNYYTWGINKEGQSLSWLEAKQCALIAVDELIKESLRSDYGFDYRQEYWQEVKQEIEKL